jgi:hypothetical protein
VSGLEVPEITTTTDNDDPKIRLLVCSVCNSVDPLPFYDGPNEYDVTGQARAQEHRHPDGRFHKFIVGTVSEKSWDNPRVRSEILSKISEETGLAPGEGSGFGQQFYNVKSTFAEDAMKCWRIDHNRTTDCQDFRSDKKRLISLEIQKDRRSEGLPSKAKDLWGNHWLCNYCPYQSHLQSKINKEKY